MTRLVYLGIKGSVIALDATTGMQAWRTELKGSDFVNIVVEDGKILAATRGEVWRLDALSGVTLWHNPLKGMGLGLITLATETSGSWGQSMALAERRRQDEAAANGAATNAANG
ncbi:MAG TPA: PQQ-binding-like beta-propeller repeat protein [Verrucomicrobiae bacterium]|nr:PQQ-binding-like beta-propeller repeat protein [Verrucomicrobiae bacterium]